VIDDFSRECVNGAIDCGMDVVGPVWTWLENRTSARIGAHTPPLAPQAKGDRPIECNPVHGRLADGD
jgi:hypothetical protein